MKRQANETDAEWYDRMCTLEIATAKKMLARGSDIDTVLSEMSNRIIRRLMHEQYIKIRELVSSNYNSTDAIESYKRLYLDIKPTNSNDI
jgi:glutamyl-tRNA reductase